jgi:hypothetical protein
MGFDLRHHFDINPLSFLYVCGLSATHSSHPPGLAQNLYRRISQENASFVIAHQYVFCNAYSGGVNTAARFLVDLYAYDINR